MRMPISKLLVVAAATAVVLPLASRLVANVQDRDRDPDRARYSEWGPPVRLGSPVNSDSFEQGPAISKDGLSLYFHGRSEAGLGGADIWVSHRPDVDAPWGEPQNLGPTINTAVNEAAPALSSDGHLLFFHSARPGGFGGSDIYVSRRHNKRDDFGWQPAQNLGPGVNTAATEQHPFVVEDDETGVITLYFASNRIGGPGGIDIYASALQPDGTFGPAVLVPGLSGPFNDKEPTVRRDGLEIYFTSDRPGTLGLDDVWVATRASTSDPWSTPENLGPGINTYVIDGAPELSFDGQTLYFQGPNSLAQPTNIDIFVTSRVREHGKDRTERDRHEKGDRGVRDRSREGELDPKEEGPVRYSDWGSPVNLGPVINIVNATAPTEFLEQAPAISKDGLSLYFHANGPGSYGGADLYVSQRSDVDAPWGAAQNLGPAINTSANEAAPALSPDGHLLFFHSGRPGGFGGADIYVSRRHNKRDDFGWQPAVNLGSNVNSPLQDQQAWIFEDDDTGVVTLYFTSNRAGGLGGNDIYASELQPDETFGPAVLVPELSSPSNDLGPTIRRDGLEIIFPSDRPGTFGLDDLWVATRASTLDPWSVPVNLGPGINTMYIDSGPAFSFDGTALYFNGPSPTFVSLDLFVITREKLKGR